MDLSEPSTESRVARRRRRRRRLEATRLTSGGATSHLEVGRGLGRKVQRVAVRRRLGVDAIDLELACGGASARRHPHTTFSVGARRPPHCEHSTPPTTTADGATGRAHWEGMSTKHAIHTPCLPWASDEVALSQDGADRSAVRNTQHRTRHTHTQHRTQDGPRDPEV